MKFFYLLVSFLIVSTFVHAEQIEQPHKNGITQIIENDQIESDPTLCDKYEWCRKARSTIFGEEESIDEDFSWTERAINFSFDIQKMKNALKAEIGLPEGQSILVLLFSLAVLLQLARGISHSQLSWIPFLVRLVVILAFLAGYSTIFNHVENFSYVISSTILGEHPFELFFSKLTLIWNIIDQDIGKTSGVLPKVYSFIKSGLIGGVVLLSYVFCLIGYYFVYLIQACILIALYYLGPIIIGLAIIPEIDFSQKFVGGFIEVLSWSVIMALLIKIMSTTIDINPEWGFSESEFLIIAVMNFCYGLAMFSVPFIAPRIFSGSGLGLVGAGLLGFTAGTIKGTMIRTGVEFVKTTANQKSHKEPFQKDQSGGLAGYSRVESLYSRKNYDAEKENKGKRL